MNKNYVFFGYKKNECDKKESTNNDSDITIKQFHYYELRSIHEHTCTNDDDPGDEHVVVDGKVTSI